METTKITFTRGKGSLPKINIQTEWSDAEIYLQGAHVTKFQRKDEMPLLFMSEKSRFEPGHPIRGGIPLIFPWFGPSEGKPIHGFARSQNWELDEVSHSSVSVTLKFVLPESDESKKLPPFKAEYLVSVGKELSLELKIFNLSNETFSFENCLHTYFEIGEICSVSVVGLKGAEYLDKIDGFSRKKENDEQIRFTAETDRVYLNTTNTIEILDSKMNRKIIVEKEGSNSTVVWNPWIGKAKAMADFGDEEYLRMVCVESGNVSENKLALKSGAISSLKVILSTAQLV